MTEKSEVRQTRRWRKSFKTKCKHARFKNILDFKKPIDFSINNSRVPTFVLCVSIYFSNEKLTEIYLVKIK